MALTCKTAFSPTDAMPYTGGAKVAMGVEVVMSFSIAALLVARAVNVGKAEARRPRPPSQPSYTSPSRGPSRRRSLRGTKTPIRHLSSGSLGCSDARSAALSAAQLPT